MIAILAISLEEGVLVSDPPATGHDKGQDVGTGKGSEIGVVPESATTMNHSEADSFRLNSTSKVTGGKLSERRKRGPATLVPSAFIGLWKWLINGICVCELNLLARYNANYLGDSSKLEGA